MRRNKGWMLGIGLLVMAALAGLLHADGRDDLSRAKDDYDSLRSRLDSTKSHVDSYLDESVKLRQMDKDQLDQLITAICKLDIEREGDEPEKIAEDLRDKVIDTVRAEYDRTVDAGSHVWDELGALESDAKSLRDRVHELESNDDVKGDAEPLREQVDQLIEQIEKLMEKVTSDRSTLDRVKDGVMAGSNNPKIRARMEYGKQMHKKMQDDFECDEREVVLSSGRPDCIKFDQDECKVIEFKPDTLSEDEAAQQAAGYLEDVRDKFKDDERAKRCKQTSEGRPIFEAVGKLYTACRP